MRNIFTQETSVVQQGCIFNGAIVDGFGDARAFGLIITPRCDIAQCKVPTVHYLPIVKFEDWKKFYLTPISQKERMERSLNELNPFISRGIIPDHLINKEYMLSDEDLEKCIQNQNIRRTVVDKIKFHWNLQDKDYCLSTISEWPKYQSRISELVDGRIERFLLLEDWKRSRDFFVICLTEIYHLTFKDAQKLKDGIKVRDIDFESNDFFHSDDPFEKYSIQAQLSSPYIEYVTQRLSNAFFRIGIEDWENRKNTIDQLK